MHRAKREKLGGRGTVGKTAVLGMVERQSNVVTAIVEEESQNAVLPQVREKILPISIVYSDEHAAYNPLKSRATNTGGFTMQQRCTSKETRIPLPLRVFRA